MASVHLEGNPSVTVISKRARVGSQRNNASRLIIAGWTPSGPTDLCGFTFLKNTTHYLTGKVHRNPGMI